MKFYTPAIREALYTYMIRYA